MIALAVVVAVAMIALLPTAPKPEPVKVWFVRATKEGGVKRLVFEGTNGLTKAIQINAFVFEGATDKASPRPTNHFFYDWVFTNAPAKANVQFNVSVPGKGVPYYVKWFFNDNSASVTSWGRFRMRCYDFFSAHSMPSVAGHFEFKTVQHIIPSTEIKE